MEEIEISSINHVSLKWTKFNSQVIWTPESVDMTLATVDCNKIKVHQQLMKTISPLFFHILQEIEPSQHPVLVITDIQFSEIQAICELLYNGEVLVPADRVTLMMKAGDKLQIKGLANEVELAENVDNTGTSIRPSIVSSETLNVVIGDSQSLIDSSSTIIRNNSEDPNNVTLNEPKSSTSKVLKPSKTTKNPFRKHTLKSAAVTTIEQSNNVTSEGTTSTATITTQLVPVISTILIDNPIPITCSICGVRCENDKILSAHMKIHRGKYIIYIPKDKNKRTVKNLVKSCPYCPYASEHVSSLSQHIRTHTGEKPFRCEKCSKAFTRKTTLKEHMRCHTGEKPFVCDQCEKRYTQKHILQNHVATCHSDGEKSFICDYCEKSFVIKKALTKHMETHKLKSIRKRIVPDEEDEEGTIEEIIEEIEDENSSVEPVKSKLFYRRGRSYKKRRRKLINQLTASDYSNDESDPEFECKLKPVSSEKEKDKSSASQDIENLEKEKFPPDCEVQLIKPTRILPKRNAPKPRKSLTPSPPPPTKRKTLPCSVGKKKSKRKGKSGLFTVKKSDPINASDYLYYKNSYNIDPINLLHQQTIEIQEPECIIEL